MAMMVDWEYFFPNVYFKHDRSETWSKEKGLLDKYDGLATAAGSETRPRYYIQYRHATMNETRGISSAEHCPLRSAEGAQGVVA